MASDPNWYGNGWWHYGGTFEVAGPATMVNLGIRFRRETGHNDQRPVIKISGLAGTESKLTTGSFLLSGAYLDVSEANMPSGWSWVTVIDSGWHSPNNCAGVSPIHFRRFLGNGVPQGPQRDVTSSGDYAGPGLKPDVAVANDGSFVIAWAARWEGFSDSTGFTR